MENIIREHFAVVFILTWLVCSLAAWGLYRFSNRPRKQLPRLRRRGTCAGCRRTIYQGEEAITVDRILFHSETCYSDYTLAVRLGRIHTYETRGRGEAA